MNSSKTATLQYNSENIVLGIGATTSESSSTMNVNVDTSLKNNTLGYSLNLDSQNFLKSEATFSYGYSNNNVNYTTSLSVKPIGAAVGVVVVVASILNPSITTKVIYYLAKFTIQKSGTLIKF